LRAAGRLLTEQNSHATSVEEGCRRSRLNLSSNGGHRRKQHPKPVRMEGANTPNPGRESTIGAESYCVTDSNTQ
jgi:hypothetical protein